MQALLVIVQTRPQMPESQHVLSWQAGEGVEAIVQPGHERFLNRRFRDSGHDIQEVALPLRSWCLGSIRSHACRNRPM